VEEIILQPAGQVRLGNRALVGLDEDPVEKGDDQGGVVGGQQAQGGVGLLELVEIIVIHFAVDSFTFLAWGDRPKVTRFCSKNEPISAMGGSSHAYYCTVRLGRRRKLSQLECLDYAPQGLKTVAPQRSKSATFLVASVRQWISAVAVSSESITGSFAPIRSASP